MQDFNYLIKTFKPILLSMIFLSMEYNCCLGQDLQYDRESISNGQESTLVKHPRLYLNLKKIETLKTHLRRRPYNKFWEHIRGEADKYSAETPPGYTDYEDEKQIAGMGERLPTMAMAYLLTGSKRYLLGVRKWMDVITSYDNWASNEDLGAAHLLFGMAVTYDWLYDYFSPEERQRYRNKITKHAHIFFLLLEKRGIWWAKALLHNHNYVNTMALSVAGISLSGEVEETPLWLDVAHRNFHQVVLLLSPDGASHEGINYWSYGMEALLRYFKAVEPIYGNEDLKNSPFFKKTAFFRLHMSLPGFRKAVNYSDSPDFEWHGPGYILRALAGYFQDGHAQWLAERIEKARGSESRYSWMDLLWYDENITPRPPDNLPTYAFFENLGVIVSRSNWEDDASWIFFKAGPPQGKLAAKKGLYRGIGHVHPDEGGFLVWNNHTWVAVDDGYVFMKRTENHNVLTFNGVGQHGQGERWFKGGGLKSQASSSEVVFNKMESTYQFIVADLTNIYPKNAQLKKWLRTFVVIGGKEIIIKDEVELLTRGLIESLIHLQGDVHKTDSSSICVGPPGGMSLLYDSLGGQSLAVGQYGVQEGERGHYGIFTGSLVSVKQIGKKSILSIFFMAPNDNDCTTTKYQLLVSDNSDLLTIQSNKRQTSVDFRNAEVRTHDYSNYP